MTCTNSGPLMRISRCGLIMARSPLRRSFAARSLISMPPGALLVQAENNPSTHVPVSNCAQPRPGLALAPSERGTLSLDKSVSTHCFLGGASAHSTSLDAQG